MIRVYVWNYRGLKTAMGHASMDVGTEHISWWPGGDRKPKLPLPGLKGLFYSVDHIQGQSFEDDQLFEALDEYSEWDRSRNQWVNRRTGRPAVPRPPDHPPLLLDGLDERRLITWWRDFNVQGRKWSTLGQNCSTTVGRGLMVAGADDYALGASGWWHSWNTVWKPDDVLRYVRAVQHGLITKRGQHAAINFVRRFCTSPLGFTPLTLTMDEKRLAEAIYHELGSNTQLISGVFRELDSKRNTDADDVAEFYVNLLRTKGGQPLAAVSRNQELRSLLIKILDEGWTSGGEKSCIAFLESLA